MDNTLKPCPNPECSHEEPPCIIPIKDGLGNEERQATCESCGLCGPSVQIVKDSKNIMSIEDGESEAARLWNALPRREAAGLRPCEDMGSGKVGKHVGWDSSEQGLYAIAENEDGTVFLIKSVRFRFTDRGGDDHAN